MVIKWQKLGKQMVNMDDSGKIDEEREGKD